MSQIAAPSLPVRRPRRLASRAAEVGMLLFFGLVRHDIGSKQLQPLLSIAGLDHREWDCEDPASFGKAGRLMGEPGRSPAAMNRQRNRVRPGSTEDGGSGYSRLWPR